MIVRKWYSFFYPSVGAFIPLTLQSRTFFQIRNHGTSLLGQLLHSLYYRFHLPFCSSSLFQTSVETILIKSKICNCVSGESCKSRTQTQLSKSRRRLRRKQLRQNRSVREWRRGGWFREKRRSLLLRPQVRRVCRSDASTGSTTGHGQKCQEKRQSKDWREEQQVSNGCKSFLVWTEKSFRKGW